MFQCIEEPTHFTENSNSLIDLLLLSNKDSLLTSGIGEPCLDNNVRYHCPVFGVFNFIKPKIKTFKRKIWKYDQGNYEELRNELRHFNWNRIYDNDVDSHAENFTNLLTYVPGKYIPWKEITIRPLDPVWMTSAIKRKIRQRKRAYKKAKKTNSAMHWSNFRKLRNEIISFIRQSKNSHCEMVSNKLRSGQLTSRDWWKTLKSLIKQNTRTSIPPLFDTATDSLVVDDHEKANVLNSFFACQSSIDDSLNQLPADFRPPRGVSLNYLVINPREVLDILNILPLGKASGPNGISNRVLRECAHQIARPLCELFNQSLNFGKVPVLWKISNVCPVYKSGDPSIPSNYRPISLLNTMEKTLERIIFKHLFNFLKESDFFTPQQSGFLPRDSTVNQLSVLYDRICKALDDGLEFRVIFFDISKAFDKVWHGGLLFKLKQSGIDGKLLNWFRNYLTNRTQRVVLPGSLSDSCFINAGVPQGSILGPILFLVYINDIVEDINSSINLFADDTSLSLVVHDPVLAATNLQADIHKIENWARKWLVKFNPAKSESLETTETCPPGS